MVRPYSPEIVKAIEYYKMLRERNGGNPYIGGDLPCLLRIAGFSKIKFSATYECYSKINKSLMGEFLAEVIEVSGKSDRALEKESIDPEESLKTTVNAVREWSENSDSIFAQSWCEVVGEKPGASQEC